MLKDPRFGFSQIVIGDWSDTCSFIEDVPFILLEAVERVCRTGDPVAVRIDAEGREYIIVFDIFETHIISETHTGYELFTEKIPIITIADELVSDIRGNVQAWSTWTDHGDMILDEKSEREKDLLVLCGIIDSRKEGAWLWKQPQE